MNQGPWTGKVDYCVREGFGVTYSLNQGMMGEAKLSAYHRGEEGVQLCLGQGSFFKNSTEARSFALSMGYIKVYERRESF